MHVLKRKSTSICIILKCIGMVIYQSPLLLKSRYVYRSVVHWKIKWSTALLIYISGELGAVFEVYVSTIYSSITKTRLYNFDSLKPHFYIVKLGFTGVYIIFLISVQKHRLWVFVRTASAHNLCFEQKFEKYLNFLSENFQFFGD